MALKQWSSEDNDVANKSWYIPTADATVINGYYTFDRFSVFDIPVKDLLLRSWTFDIASTVLSFLPETHDASAFNALIQLPIEESKHIELIRRSVPSNVYWGLTPQGAPPRGLTPLVGVRKGVLERQRNMLHV